MVYRIFRSVAWANPRSAVGAAGRKYSGKSRETKRKKTSHASRTVAGRAKMTTRIRLCVVLKRQHRILTLQLTLKSELEAYRAADALICVTA